ncbi:polar amino acid transport system substrate-binding protein [Herbaspirillum sp. Sphag1AN]|uniref:transporter substrate-binding domain-containing protein n=1 Tax=unclassified Herbaspirillum TaxID=2624150 RepID=UPI00160E2297|nr:polar amino acid transport system substrate-binding protein [Herbaspirillum sp. Sphag1AN]MBB3245977.1 polar amino acid transport system substrate-binding protein [Herbaspirillum sp. Sphag64]
MRPSRLLDSLFSPVIPLLTAILLIMVSNQARADATLDKIHQRGKIIVGVLLDGTYGSIDPATRKPQGYSVELAESLAKHLGVTLETVAVVPPNRVQFLQQGKVDALIASMQYTKERAEILSYVPTPFEEIGGSAMVRKDSGIKNWSDLRGKPVCVSQGSNYSKPLIEQYGAEVKGFKGMPEALLGLRGGNCVASVHVTPGIQSRLRNDAAEWKDYESPMPVQLIPSPSVIWVRKGETDTVAAFDNIVQDWHRSGFLINEGNQHNMPPSAFLLSQHDKFKNLVQSKQ